MAPSVVAVASQNVAASFVVASWVAAAACRHRIAVVGYVGCCCCATYSPGMHFVVLAPRSAAAVDGALLSAGVPLQRKLFRLHSA